MSEQTIFYELTYIRTMYISRISKSEDVHLVEKFDTEEEAKDWYMKHKHMTAAYGWNLRKRTYDRIIKKSLPLE